MVESGGPPSTPGVAAVKDEVVGQGYCDKKDKRRRPLDELSSEAEPAAAPTKNARRSKRLQRLS